MYDKKITLSNGVEIPQLGLGTWLVEDEDVAEVVKNAINIGYRHIDSAQAYGNERGVGEGIRKSGVPREELFIVSKVAAEIKTYEEAKKSIDESLEKMQLDYLDLMIIHSPQPWALVGQSDDRFFEGNREVWKALEEAYKDGKLKAIGVSNFVFEDIENILEVAEIKPMINQICIHIGNTWMDLINYCKDKDMAVEAYSPIAHGNILNDERISEIAAKYNVSVAQLCIKYLLQLDLIPLPKTLNPDHMKSNTEVDFEISDEDMEVLKNL